LSNEHDINTLVANTAVNVVNGSIFTVCGCLPEFFCAAERAYAPVTITSFTSQIPFIPGGVGRLGNASAAVSVRDPQLFAIHLHIDR
jgi:hypothetical protein